MFQKRGDVALDGLELGQLQSGVCNREHISARAVFIDEDPPAAFHIAVYRTIEVIVGTLTAFLVTHALLPDADRPAPKIDPEAPSQPSDTSRKVRYLMNHIPKPEKTAHAFKRLP